MSREVFLIRYCFLPSWSILDSHFNERQRRALEETNKNSTPPKSNTVIKESDLSPRKSFSTPPRNSPVLSERNSTPKKDNSSGAGNTKDNSENHLTPSKFTSTPDQNSQMVSGDSPRISFLYGYRNYKSGLQIHAPKD